MRMLQLAGCFGMIFGWFLVLNLSFGEFSESVFQGLLHPKKTLRTELNEFTHRKKPSLIRREIIQAQSSLAADGKSEKFPLICAVSLALLIFGAVAAIYFRNAFLVPVLAVGMMFLPFWYVRLTAGNFKKEVSAELETALSVITTAYLRSENFTQAVEENVRYLAEPVQGVFQRFLARIKHLDPDINAALGELKSAIDNEVWQEWCDAVAACQTDRTLKTILPPIVNKLSDMRLVNGELELLTTQPRKEFYTMALLTLGNIPLVRFINADWYATLTQTPLGQAVIAICVAAVFVSFSFVVRLTQPIEYRR